MVNSAIAIQQYKDWINGLQGFKVQLLWLHTLPNICKVQLFMVVTVHLKFSGLFLEQLRPWLFCCCCFLFCVIYMKKNCLKKIPLTRLLTNTLNMCSIKNAQKSEMISFFKDQLQLKGIMKLITWKWIKLSCCHKILNIIINIVNCSISDLILLGFSFI